MKASAILFLTAVSAFECNPSVSYNVGTHTVRGVHTPSLTYRNKSLMREYEEMEAIQLAAWTAEADPDEYPVQESPNRVSYYTAQNYYINYCKRMLQADAEMQDLVYPALATETCQANFDYYWHKTDLDTFVYQPIAPFSEDETQFQNCNSDGHITLEEFLASPINFKARVQNIKAIAEVPLFCYPGPNCDDQIGMEGGAVWALADIGGACDQTNCP